MNLKVCYRRKIVLKQIELINIIIKKEKRKYLNYLSNFRVNHKKYILHRNKSYILCKDVSLVIKYSIYNYFEIIGFIHKLLIKSHTKISLKTLLQSKVIIIIVLYYY